MSFVPYEPPAELMELLRANERFWLATHVHPDADGFGSELGLGLALKAAGKQVSMILEDGVPTAFTALPGFEQTVNAERLEGSPDAVIQFDCHSLSRIGPAGARVPDGVPLVVIDHHLTGEEGGDGHLEWIRSDAAASAALVYSLVVSMDELELTADVATCLYAGLLTDTGGFRFSNTTAETLGVAAELVRAGADAAELADAFIHRRSPATLLLMSKVLDTFDYRFGGRVVLARMTRQMCEETGARMEDTEGFVNFATSADGVSLVALLKEEEPTRWRLSLRANDPYDVQRVATPLGGGGHAKAAGCTLEGDAETAETIILEAFGAELERGASAS